MFAIKQISTKTTNKFYISERRVFTHASRGRDCAANKNIKYFHIEVTKNRLGSQGVPNATHATSCCLNDVSAKCISTLAPRHA